MTDAYGLLTDKEKETLRLILHGHDAKSMARELDLSVHTVNERLRNARRKLEVTSSKEAARLLLEEEGDSPQLPPNFMGHKQLGEAGASGAAAQAVPPKARTGRALITGGILLMSLLLAVLALNPSLPFVQSEQSDTRSFEVATADAEMEAAAREWLALVDAGEWRASYDATGAAFRELNTSQVWEEISQDVRVPLGAVNSREAISFQQVPTPPAGHLIVTFRTSFAGQPDTMETVTLAREDGELRVVGYLIG
ncbi:DUF4019 domain-containing protein [Aurantiacibacter gilvus]|uniref:DUF4019 domain-containing protein n=1 Tax=Aurantiacibacter gilvus TaxID=3139141 RepID=A0ABU9IHQ2_9SPHN